MHIDITQGEEIYPLELSAKLLEEVDEHTRKWVLENTDGDFPVAIPFTEQAYVLKELGNLPEPLEPERAAIEAWINDFLREELERHQSGFDDSEEGERDEPQPYDPHKINIRDNRWSISHMFELIDKWDQVDLSPDFQRGFVWDYKRKSQLIESLMLRIPIPAFYLAETSEGKYQVVDGLQRLITITQFMKNEFSLKYLEYLEDQEGRWFEDKGRKKGIERNYWRNILQTQITVNIIEAKSPAKVKFDVFRRINTGGKPLNNQEIRNCLSEKHTRDLIKSLAFSKDFRLATGGSVSSGRMQAQELVLRFIGFWHDRILQMPEWEYKGNMTEYLDGLIELLNQSRADRFSEIKAAFRNGMQNAYHLFGQYCFRKYLPEHFEPGTRQQLINKSLFTTWSVVLSTLDVEMVKKTVESGSFAHVLADRLKRDSDYYNSVSYKTNDRVYVERGFTVAWELVNSIK